MNEETATPTKFSKASTKIEYTESNFHLHSFRTELGEQKIMFQVIKMKDSVYIWIGELNKPMLQNLALAMQNKYDSTPVSTSLLGDIMNTSSKSIATKLSRKLKKVVYLSYNLPESIMDVPLIEKRLMEEIKNKPDCF